MNFAAPAVLLVLLLLPGVIFRGAFHRGRWDSYPFRAGPLAEEIALGALASLLIHTVAVFFVSASGTKVRFDYLLCLLYGPAQNSAMFHEAVTAVSDHVGQIAQYLVVVYAFSWLAGYGLHNFIRWSKLDLQSKVFRFDHKWHYLFSGEILDFDRPAGPFRSRNYSATLVAALVDQEDGSFIYRGTLRRYFFDRDGELDQIVLEHPERAKLKDVESLADLDEARFAEIMGHFLVLEADDIRNLNILYVQTQAASNLHS